MNDYRRLAMRVAYDGTDFVGWQRQTRGRSVQGILEHVFGRLAGDQPVRVVGAGRTDSGVHARGQVAHVDMPNIYDLDDLLHRVGRMLPVDVAILDIAAVPDSFHARFRACSRLYRYTIVNCRDPFQSRYAWYVPTPSDLVTLSEAAARLIGTHDFTGLSKMNPDTPDPYCTVTVAQWTMYDHGMVFEIAADRFLYGMVRLIVGIMIDVARCRRPVRDLSEILESTERGLQSPSAPACGLSLDRVDYPVSPFTLSTH